MSLNNGLYESVINKLIDEEKLKALKKSYKKARNYILHWRKLL